MSALTRRARPAPAPRRRRGYLLLEVMIGGVLAASILGFLMVTWVHARNLGVKAARSSVAADLAAHALEVARSLDYADLSAANLPATGPVVGLKGSYDRTVTLTTGTEVDPTGSGEDLDYTDITVTISFVLTSGQVEDVTVAMRRYDPQ